jgi:hypothetical protein
VTYGDTGADTPDAALVAIQPEELIGRYTHGLRTVLPPQRPSICSNVELTGRHSPGRRASQASRKPSRISRAERDRARRMLLVPKTQIRSS